MQKKVEEYLSAVDKQLRESKEKRRMELLKNAGIVEREYGTDTRDDLHTDYDSEKGLFYCERVLPVTDEEYEAIEKAYNSKKALSGEDENNGVASMLKIIGILTYIGVFLVGFLLGRDPNGNFSLLSAMVYWVVGWVSGSLFIGFSEIVNLLHAIKRKL